MRRSTRKIVPVWSDDSMYEATPVRDPFFKTMEQYNTLEAPPSRNCATGSPLSYGSGEWETASANCSETSGEYNARIKRQNSCFKCCSFLSFLACVVGVSVA
jgi:hypothetical protein